MAGVFSGKVGGSWFTFLAMAFAGIAGLLVFAVLQSDREQSPVIETVSVVVATVEIPARTVITETMVRAETLPVEVAVERGFRDVSAVVGQISRYPIAPREQLTALKVGPSVTPDGLAQDGLSFVIPPGKRAIGISVTEPPWAA